MAGPPREARRLTSRGPRAARGRNQTRAVGPRAQKVMRAFRADRWSIARWPSGTSARGTAWSRCWAGVCLMVCGWALPEHVVSAEGRFPALEAGSLAAGQVPADRPVQRGKRRRSGHVRIVGCSLYELGVDSGGVSAPQRQQPPDFRGDREMGRLRPGEAIVLTSSGQPPSHRPLRLPQRLCHQVHMRNAELVAAVQIQKGGHRRRPPQRRREHGHRSVYGCLITSCGHSASSPRASGDTSCRPLSGISAFRHTTDSSHHCPVPVACRQGPAGAQSSLR